MIICKHIYLLHIRWAVLSCLKIVGCQTVLLHCFLEIYSSWGASMHTTHWPWSMASSWSIKFAFFPKFAGKSVQPKRYFNKKAFQLNANCPLSDILWGCISVQWDANWTSLNMSSGRVQGPGQGWGRDRGPVQRSPSLHLNRMTDTTEKHYLPVILLPDGKYHIVMFLLCKLGLARIPFLFKAQ